MKSSATVSPPVAGERFAFGSRRDFIRTAAVGGAALAIPSLLTGCKVGETTLGSTGPTGPLLTIDFATGDTAYIKFLSVYKQMQADLYTRMVAVLATSDLTTTEQALVSEIKNHEIIHRDTIAAILGTVNAVTVTPKWGNTNFKKASEIMSSAINFEDVSVGLYNGMLQHFIVSANIQFALEIQSVEARHAAALRDEVVPKNGGPSGFSPGSSDAAYALSAVSAAIQPLITETLQFINAPAGL